MNHEYSIQLDWEREAIVLTIGILEVLDNKGLRHKAARDRHGDGREIRELLLQRV
jgi:hypothetical protein